MTLQPSHTKPRTPSHVYTHTPPRRVKYPPPPDLVHKGFNPNRVPPLSPPYKHPLKNLTFPCSPTQLPPTMGMLDKAKGLLKGKAATVAQSESKETLAASNLALEKKQQTALRIGLTANEADSIVVDHRPPPPKDTRKKTTVLQIQVKPQPPGVGPKSPTKKKKVSTVTDLGGCYYQEGCPVNVAGIEGQKQATTAKNTRVAKDSRVAKDPRVDRAFRSAPPPPLSSPCVCPPNLSACHSH